MSLAQELCLSVDRWNYVYTYRINLVENVNERLDEIVAFIKSCHTDGLYLTQPPVSKEVGHRVSQALASNPHITEIRFSPDRGVAMRDLIPWIASRGTLVNMMSVAMVVIILNVDMCSQDCDELFSLLLTSASLRDLRVLWNRCGDNVMSALARYLGTSSLENFFMNDDGVRIYLSQAAFYSLCEGISVSTLRKLTLGENVFRALNVETAAESLAWAIAQSSLEEVEIWDTSICLALARTTSVQNFDFAFSQIENNERHLRINRKWKPLVSVNIIPLGLFPRILEKVHASPETSHGPVAILFYLLSEKPDLIPATT